jgi:hypothetical protein
MEESQAARVDKADEVEYSSLAMSIANKVAAAPRAG